MDTQQTTREAKNAFNGATKKNPPSAEKSGTATPSSLSLEDLRLNVEHALDQVRESGRSMVSRSDAWMKANPYKALCGAAAVGVVATALFKKRRSNR